MELSFVSTQPTAHCLYCLSQYRQGTMFDATPLTYLLPVAMLQSMVLLDVRAYPTAHCIYCIQEQRCDPAALTHLLPVAML